MSKTENTFRDLKIVRIRREIEIYLHSPLSEEEWEDLIEENYIEELLNDDLSSSEVAEKVRRRRLVYGQRRSKQGNATQMLSDPDAKETSGRLKALSILVAQEAAKDEDVQTFRTEVLGGELLSFETVEEWIQGQAEVEGPHTWWLSDVPMQNQNLDLAIAVLMESGIFDKHEQPLWFQLEFAPFKDEFLFHFLKYSIPGTKESKEIPTAVRGALEHLRWLSEKLAHEYGWTETEATVFVLVGAVPEIKAITSTFQSKQLPALTRIVLTIDPTLSPQEVAEHYRGIRRDVIVGRHRDLSEKHLQLAIFAAKQPEDEIWADKMAEWNKTHPAEWKYEEISNFAHDCLQAHRRLLRSEKE
jgi:hypothetical protein